MKVGTWGPEDSAVGGGVYRMGGGGEMVPSVEGKMTELLSLNESASRC